MSICQPYQVASGAFACTGAAATVVVPAGGSGCPAGCCAKTGPALVPDASTNRPAPTAKPGRILQTLPPVPAQWSETLAETPTIAVWVTFDNEVSTISSALDDEAKKHIATEGAEGISGKTAANVWSVVRTSFKESISARDRSLRVRTCDPSAGHKPPLESPPRKKTFLYPTEAAKLLACAKVGERNRDKGCTPLSERRHARRDQQRACLCGPWARPPS